MSPTYKFRGVERGVTDSCGHVRRSRSRQRAHRAVITTRDVMLWLDTADFDAVRTCDQYGQHVAAATLLVAQCALVYRHLQHICKKAATEKELRIRTLTLSQ
ncbi:hypothetical protein ACJJTC_014615 [Scirpophaga incertulas]